MKLLQTLVLAPVAAFVLTVSAFAADPSGTWKWTATGPGGQSFESTLKLEMKDGKLAGTITNRRGETPISDATFAGDQVKFSVVRERDGQKWTSKYDGKLEGDTIKGKYEMPGRDGGEARTVDWTATRAKSSS